MTPSDAGAYYVQAVNERNGENKTSPPIHLSVARESCGPGCGLSSEVSAGPGTAVSWGSARGVSPLQNGGHVLCLIQGPWLLSLR